MDCRLEDEEIRLVSRNTTSWRWSVVESTLKVPKDPLDRTQVWFVGIVHVEIDLLDNIRSVGPSKCEILKSSDKIMVDSLLESLAYVSTETTQGACISTLDDIQGVSSLLEKESKRPPRPRQRSTTFPIK